MRENILIKGKPGIGKTTLIKRLVERLEVEKGGFYTEEMREHGFRVGFRIVTLDGRKGILAHVGIRSKFRVGKYFVNISDIDNMAVDSIISSLNKDVIIIDEIGRMELISEKFKDAVLKALNKGRVLGTIKATSDKFTDEIMKRNDTKVIEINLRNRNNLIDKILSCID